MKNFIYLLFMLSNIVYAQLKYPYIFSDTTKKLIYKISIHQLIDKNLKENLPNPRSGSDEYNSILSGLLFNSAIIALDDSNSTTVRMNHFIDTLEMSKIDKNDKIVFYNNISTPYIPKMARYENDEISFYRNYSIEKYSIIYVIPIPIRFHFKWKFARYFNFAIYKIIPKDTVIFLKNTKLICKKIRKDHISDLPPFNVIETEFLYINKKYGIVKIRRNKIFTLDLIDIIEKKGKL